MKLLADGSEDVAPRPLVDEPEEVEVPPVIAPEQNEDEAAAVHRDRLVKEDHWVLPLLFGIRDPEDERVLVGGTLEIATCELGEHLFRVEVVIELDEFDGAGQGVVRLDREPLVRDVVVHPIVLPATHELGGLGPLAGVGEDVSGSMF